MQTKLTNLPWAATAPCPVLSKDGPRFHSSITRRVIPLLQGLTVLVFFTCLLITPARAQAPIITSTSGVPVGNTSGMGIAYGNGVYVSVFNNGSIYSSANGTAWSKVSNPGIPSGFFRLAFGTGVFVLAGDGGRIFTSTDGLTWTSRASGTVNNLTDVQFLQSAFFAAGNNRTLLTSSDGINWSTVTIGVGGANDMLMNITYGGGVFAIGARSSGSGVYIYRSTTGASNSWTVQNVDAGESLNKVQYLKDRFYIFCSGTRVFTSTDANSWTNSTPSMTLTLPDASTQTIGSPNQVFNGIYDGSKFYLFGYSQYYNSYGSIFSSTDGVHFTLEPKTAYIVCQGSAYLNNRYFEYGNEGFVSSTDGLNYSYAGNSYNALAFNGTGYVGVGTISSMGVVYSSPDFSTWTDRTMAGQKELYGVAYTGTNYVAVGNQSVLQSSDGSSWTQIATPGDAFTALAFGATRLVAGGYDVNTNTAKIAYSPDGIAWTTANTNDNWYFKVKYVNGNFFALGYSNTTYLGVILHSTDGTSWSDITPNLSFPVYYFNDVVYDGSKFHFMGMEYDDPALFSLKGFFSVSTVTLNGPNSFSNKGTISSPPGVLGGNFGEGAFAYRNGHFAGSVNDIATNEAYVVYSSDGITWTAAATGETTAISGIEAAGNVFRLLGTNNGKLTVIFNAALPVHLLQFTASLVNGQSLLQWQTATEQNSSHFVVQHSTDGVTWHSIGTVKAAGESQVIQNYQFLHTTPVSGLNYYRIIETDIDGKQQTSKVLPVELGTPLSMRLSPNPASDWLFLQTNGSGLATVSVYTLGGQLMLRKSFDGNNTRLSLSSLPGGLYHVVAEQGGQRYTQQLFHP
jgi:hypothetical protein